MAGTVSHLEMVWTLIAVAGLLFSAWLTLAGWADFQAVESAIRRTPPLARRWGPRWWVGLSAVVANLTLIVAWAVFIFIGIMAMQWPPPPPTTEQAVANTWVGWALILAELVIAGVQGWHLFVRGRVEHETPTVAIMGRLAQVAEDGREMGHLVAGEIQRPMTLLEEMANHPALPEDRRAEARAALMDLDTVLVRVRLLHQEIRDLGGPAARAP